MIFFAIAAHAKAALFGETPTGSIEKAPSTFAKHLAHIADGAPLQGDGFEAHCGHGREEKASEPNRRFVPNVLMAGAWSVVVGWRYGRRDKSGSPVTSPPLPGLGF